MPVKRQNGKKKRLSKEVETVDLINQALKDLHELRRLASVRGLVNPHLRKQVWPQLLGVSAISNSSTALEEPQAQPSDDSGRARRDASTIENDVARCLHEGQVDVGTGDRTALRSALTRLLHSVTDGQNVYYYQGLHEIAMTLLLQVGEAQAQPLLRRLVCTQLRDNTRETLDAVTESLEIVQAIISNSDAELGAHLQRAQVPPYFAISWVITWFAHNVDSTMVPRLFDLFLASHPLMPLYLYVAGVLEVRDDLLALDTMEDLHTFLVNFNPFAAVGKGFGVNALAMKAVKLIKKLPPDKMARRCARRFVHSCAVEAQLVNDTWWVPEAPPQRAKLPEVVQSLGENPALRRVVLAPLAATAVAGIAVLLTLAPPATRFPEGPL